MQTICIEKEKPRTEIGFQEKVVYKIELEACFYRIKVKQWGHILNINY
jgi:hypothetical protein